MDKKISFITSLDVNVGDEFIREGIFSFFDEIYPQWSPYYVNKVDLSTIFRKVKDEKEYIGDKLLNADIIVQAGAPVYWNLGSSTSYNVEWADELWFKRIFRLGPEKAILNIAAGACQPFPDSAKTFLSDPACVDFALKVDNACRWTSVRDPLASQILHALSIEHDALPCSAFHAARRLSLIECEDDLIGINFMKLGGHFKFRENISADNWLGVIKKVLSEVRKSHRVLFIAHDQEEQKFLSALALAGEEVFISGSHIEYMKAYARCSMVIANRVHGGVCAAGFGRSVIIIGNDTRLQIADYIGIKNHYVGKVTADDILRDFEELRQNKSKERDRLLELRESSAIRYRTAITKALEYQKISSVPMPNSCSLSLATLKELESDKFIDFMKTMNCFASRLNLRQFTNWSKLWEYPWIWQNALSEKRNWNNISILDLGSEISPMPWFLASFGAKVTLVECDKQWIPRWEKIKEEAGLSVNWKIVSDEHLPFRDSSFDIVTSFSVIEHQRDKVLAVNEVCRVLKPGGLFALSFDICEPSMGMTFPEWNGSALTMAAFEDVAWNHSGFISQGRAIWNTADISSFIEWHKRTAEHHNYVVGAAVLRKKLFEETSIKRLLLPRFDTHGDILLMKGFIDALLQRFPEAEITLFVREGYEQLKPLFSDRLVWRTQPFNPWERYSKEMLERVVDSLREVAKEKWDLVLFTTFNRTFLEDILAAMLPESPCIGLGNPSEHHKWQTRAFAKLNFTVEGLYDQIVPVEVLTHETEKYQKFWEVLFAQDMVLPLPEIGVPEELLKSADLFLEAVHLKPGKYVACMPAGLHNVKIKKWPEELFAQAINWIASEHGLMPLLIGHESEKDLLEKVKSLAEAQGATDVKIWLGNNGSMGVLAALLKKSALYLGNDSLPMHIANGVGVPTVGIYGGGTWPRFSIKGARSICVVAQLPCFYCMWDCIFGDAPCLKLLTLDDVKAAIDKVLSGDVPEDHIQHAALSISVDSRELVAKASTKYKDLQEQLKLRQEVIDSLESSLEDSYAENLHLNEVLHSMKNSLSWRISAPLRKVLDIIRRS